MDAPASHEPTIEELFAKTCKTARPQPEPAPVEPPADQPALFVPQPPSSFEEAGVSEALAESLVLKYLLANGQAKGREMSDDLALPMKDFKQLMVYLKNQQLVFYRDSGQLDFTYALTEQGRDRAKKFQEECAYLGPIPVPLDDYIDSVGRQSIKYEQPLRADLERAFSDLLISDSMFERLGPAVNSGRGLFLYGAPGNGKTSIAERITQCFSAEVWIPRSLVVDGQIVLVYDPQVHEPVKMPNLPVKSSTHDDRWIKIKRPTIVVGGELTMNALEITYDPISKLSHAPLQLKSNCGTLVIDDFGRQRMNPFELLNRWIIPLENRHDFLQLVNGKKIQVPFDQLIIFSTNLEPRDLVDDAFLRRIPYKIEVVDPTEDEFRQLLKMMSDQLVVEYDDAAIDHLMDRYKGEDRSLRCCHPRDLLLQIKNKCSYEGCEPVMSTENFDFAMTNYFTVV